EAPHLGRHAAGARLFAHRLMLEVVDFKTAISWTAHWRNVSLGVYPVWLNVHSGTHRERRLLRGVPEGGRAQAQAAAGHVPHPERRRRGRPAEGASRVALPVGEGARPRELALRDGQAALPDVLA